MVNALELFQLPGSLLVWLFSLSVVVDVVDVVDVVGIAVSKNLAVSTHLYCHQ